MHYSSHVYLAMEVLAGHQHLHWVMGTYLLTNLIFCPSSYPDDGLAPPNPCLLNALGIIAGEKQKNIHINFPTWKDGVPPPVGWGGSA